MPTKHYKPNPKPSLFLQFGKLIEKPKQIKTIVYGYNILSVAELKCPRFMNNFFEYDEILTPHPERDIELYIKGVLVEKYLPLAAD